MTFFSSLFSIRMVALRALVLPVTIGILLSPVLLLRSSAAEDQVAILQDSLQDLQSKWQNNQQAHDKTLQQIQREHSKKQRELETEANEIRTALCEAGKLEYCPEAQKAKNVNIVKLARAVAEAETSNCTAGVGRTLNNCFGMRNNGKFLSYASKEESYRAFMDMWLRVYGDTFPTRSIASRYTANDTPDRWLRVVTVVYNRD